MAAERSVVIFFDVGGTLVEVSPSVGHVYARACTARGARVAPEEVQGAFDAAWVAMSQQVPRGADRYRFFPGGEREWWERVSSFAFDRCGVPHGARPEVDELRAVFARPDAWRVFPETRATLEDLRKRGYRLGVLSNWDSRLPVLLETLGLREPFDTVVYSAAAGYEKPHPGIFAAALRSAGVEPARAVHVGDRLDEDYAGARAAGLGAVLVSRADRGAELRREVRRWGDEADLVADLDGALRRIIG